MGTLFKMTNNSGVLPYYDSIDLCCSLCGKLSYEVFRPGYVFPPIYDQTMILWAAVLTKLRILPQKNEYIYIYIYMRKNLAICRFNRDFVFLGKYYDDIFAEHILREKYARWICLGELDREQENTNKLNMTVNINAWVYLLVFGIDEWYLQKCLWKKRHILKK